MSNDRLKDEVERNFAVFIKTLPDLLRTHPGKFAVMHSEAIVEFCDTFGDALILGKALFPNSAFSVQEVKMANLGY
jgi:hypothetical protein